MTITSWTPVEEGLGGREYIYIANLNACSDGEQEFTCTGIYVVAILSYIG